MFNKGSQGWHSLQWQYFNINWIALRNIENKNVKTTKMLKIAGQIKLKRRNNVLPNKKNSIHGRKHTNEQTI